MASPSARYVLAIDQGTTGTTALLVDHELRVRAKENREFAQIFPRPGWVEHDLETIWASVRDAVVAVLTAAGARAESIEAIGIANQRETTALWDRRTSVPVANAIVWQCRRTAPACEALKKAGHEPMFRKKTGLVLDPYFSGTKIAWLLDHVEGARARAVAGALAFGTIDTFLVWRLTGGAAHVTDVSNASRTLLLDIATVAWDDELCRVLGVPRAILPEVRGSSEVVGKTRGLDFLPDGIPIAGMAGDQQAALFGQACFSAGMAKCTYGTGAFLLMNTGGAPVVSRHGLLTTLGWRALGETVYALEGSAFIAGAAVQWLRDGLKIIQKASDIEALAKTVAETGDVAFVPALAGLGAPYWDPHARGLFCGMTRDTTAGHLARAVLEGIAFQIHDLASAMAQDAGRQVAALRVDGGAAQNDLMMQFQADLLGVEVVRPEVIETTGLGAALLAGLSVGMFDGRSAVEGSWRAQKVFRPIMEPQERNLHLQKWRRAVERAQSGVHLA